MAARTGFLASAWSYLNSMLQDPAPIRQASPESDKAKPKTGTMFTRSYDGFAIGASWLEQLAINPDSILKKEGVQDLALFDALLDDDTAFSTFQQRRLALRARPWVVEPGDPDDARSVQAADDLRDMLKLVGWDRVCGLMHYGVWYGYAVAEAMFSVRQHNGRSLIWLDGFVVPDRKWFGFTNAGRLKMRTPQDANGAEVPNNKFWSFRTGASHDFAHYGTGLAHWCYWPVWFKRNVQQFWALYLEKYGQPTVVGYFQPGTPQEKIEELLSTLTAIGSDSAVAVPAPVGDPVGGGGTDLRPHLLEAQRSGGADSYVEFYDKMDAAITRIVLSQTMTSTAAASGLGSNQADVQDDVKDEVVKADSDEMHESFNQTVPKWLTVWNYGPDVAPPTVYRSMENEESVDTTADRDVKLKTLGWVRTEDSFKEVYGDGYEKAPEPVPVPGAANGNGNPIARRAANFAADDPAPLYVFRQLLNPTPLLDHMREQGFTELENAKDLHVTILYSRKPVDWFEMDDRWGMSEERYIVPKGGARKVERMGESAVALVFGAPQFRYRHDSMVEMGASHDYASYLPHITFTYAGTDIDLSTVVPYEGKLIFGPEMFRAIDDGQDAPAASMPTFSADQLDQIDALSSAMVEHSDPIFAAMGTILVEEVGRLQDTGQPMTADAFRVAMLQAWERFPTEKLAAAMALPFTAEHAAAEVGAEDDVVA